MIGNNPHVTLDEVSQRFPDFRKVILLNLHAEDAHADLLDLAVNHPASFHVVAAFVAAGELHQVVRIAKLGVVVVNVQAQWTLAEFAVGFDESH